MPVTWETPEQENGGEFLKLNDGDSALIVLMGPPMIVKKHTLPKQEGETFGQRFYCGTEEGVGCPICENPDTCDADTLRKSVEGFYAIWVEGINERGNPAVKPIQKMMIDSGGWAKIGAYKAAKESQELDGLEFVGIPMRISRTGDKQNTKYDIQMRPTAKVVPEGDPVDVETVALRMIAKHHESLGYTKEDPFEDTSSGTANLKPTDDPQAFRDLFLSLAKEAGFTNDKTRDAYLKGLNIVVRTVHDLPPAIQAMKDRIARMNAGQDEPDAFDWSAEEAA